MFIADHRLTDTLYIDLARHAETPVPALKALFKHWWAKAAWHRPSVILFDNVDKLMGVELEVRSLHSSTFFPDHIVPSCFILSLVLHCCLEPYSILFFFPASAFACA